ncbi:MAG TPA: hypothetical protein VHM19_15670, partial [Polyangiales bacterium]|nr:hypothetical protein [Polyangiales bacterium]
MISYSKLWVLAVVSMFVVSCGGGGGGGVGSAAGSESTLATGLCADTCPKPCATDNDCMTANGELCCDFGADGKACTDAKACPRQCESDSKCDTFHGEACVRVTLESSLEVCAEPSQGLALCKADGDCKGSGDVCCTAYDEPVCLPANLCPKSCATSSECQTGSGELCCTTLAQVDTTLKAGGLCVAPT